MMRAPGWLKKFAGLFFKRFREGGGFLAPDADLRLYVDRIVSDGILLNEIPSPSEQEERRGEFIKRKLLEFGLDDIHTDELGNVFVIFPGLGYTRRYLLMYTDLDNLKYSTAESIVEIKGDRLYGIGLGDNSLGASALLVLCEYLKKNNVALDFNLIALFSLRNAPEYDFAGIRAFLQKWKNRIFGSVYLFGLNQGRLVADSYGICNLSFRLTSANLDALGKNYTDSTVDCAARFYNGINGVDWAASNAIVNIVRMSSGIGFEYFPAEGTMDIEVFSKDPRSLATARAKIVEIAAELSTNKYFTVENSAVSIIPRAEDVQNEFLNAIVKKVHAQLHIETKATQIPDYSSILNQFTIPSVTLGLATGRKSLNEEYVNTKPILSGFKQALLFLEELNKSMTKAG